MLKLCSCVPSFGPGSGHIWLDDVICTGEEFFIQECGHSDIGENNCFHNEDVGLKCLRESHSQSLILNTHVSIIQYCHVPMFHTFISHVTYCHTPVPIPANTLEVRLVDGLNSSSGRVEVNYNNEEWGTICDDRYGGMGMGYGI